MGEAGAGESDGAAIERQEGQLDQVDVNIDVDEGRERSLRAPKRVNTTDKNTKGKAKLTDRERARASPSGA